MDPRLRGRLREAQMTRSTISFWDENKTERLRNLLTLDEDLIRKLLEALPRKPDAPNDLVEKASKKLCLNVRNYASSEIQRFGWHRSAPARTEIDNLRAVEKSLSDVLVRFRKLRRGAMELLFLNGVGHSHAASIVKLRNAVRASIDQLKPAAKREGPKRSAGRDRTILADRITFAAAVAYREVTGMQPLEPHRRGSHKNPTKFPDFLSALFDKLGITANVEHQLRKLAELRMQNDAAREQP